MLVFEERRKPKNPEKKLSEQQRTSNKLNPHKTLGVKWAFSPLRHSLDPYNDNEIIHSLTRDYLKIWMQEFSRPSSRGLKWGKWNLMLGGNSAMDQYLIRGEVEILLVASCYRNCWLFCRLNLFLLALIVAWIQENSSGSNDSSSEPRICGASDKLHQQLSGKTKHW